MAISVRFDASAVDHCAGGAGWDEIADVIAKPVLAFGIALPSASEVCRTDRR